MRWSGRHFAGRDIQSPELLPWFPHGIAEQGVAADLCDYGSPVFQCVQGMLTVFAYHFCAPNGKGLGYG